MCDVDIVDTVTWYAAESVDLAVYPWRCGKPVEIPDGASACWIVADECGTNWLARYADTVESNRVTFSFGAGEGALPDEHEYSGFLTLLSGTNVLGVLDRHDVRVLWNPQDDVVPVEPPASGWPAILAWLQDGIEGYISTNATVSSNSAAIQGLWEAIGLATNLDAIAAIESNRVAIAELAEEVATHPTNSFALSAAMQGQRIKMDLFDVTLTPKLADTGISTGAVSQALSVMAAPVVTSNYMGYLLTPTIYAATSETNEVRYTVLHEEGTLSTNELGEVFFRNSLSGLSGVRADFGSASKVYRPNRLTNSATTTNWIWTADATGTFREAVNASCLAADGEKELDPFTTTDTAWRGTRNTNFFLGTNWDFRCMTVTSDNGFAGTLVTPRHAIVASHCGAAIGQRLYFLAAGSPESPTVTGRKSLGLDRCVVRLSYAVSTNTYKPALLLDGPAAWQHYVTLPDNVSGVPGLYAVTFHRGRVGQVSRIATPLDKDQLWLIPATNALPAAVAGMRFAGGDSSYPTFLLAPDTDRPILVGCSHAQAGGEGLTPNWASDESWRLLTNAIAELDGGTAEYLPERYSLAGWPDYSDVPTPAPASEPEEP